MDNSFLTSIAFQLISLFYISIVVIKYYRTEKFQTLDNFVYKILLYCMVLILIVDMSSVAAAFISNIESINLTLCKVYLVLLLSWLLLKS